MEFKLNTINTPKRTYHLVDPESLEKFRDITEEIKNKYSIKMPNRDLIIKSIIASLVHGDFKHFNIPKINIAITRSDIKDCYPTINKHSLYQKLNRSNVLSQRALSILKKILFNRKFEGIPLGLPFSNHLAEFFMEIIDKEINLDLEPVVYFRYIDDFICINYCEYMDEDSRKLFASNIKTRLEVILEEQKLNINDKKTTTSFYLFNPTQMDKNSDLNFTYLGYTFKTNEEKLIIEISDEKLNQYSKRLNSYLYKFRIGKNRNIDFWRLYYKILNELHGITTLDKKNNKMKSGLAYHYRYVNCYENLHDFIKYYKKVVISLKLNSSKTHLLLNLFSNASEDIIFMQKRFNYLNLTEQQREKISKRLGFAYRKKDSKDFIKKMIWSLYKKR